MKRRTNKSNDSSSLQLEEESIVFGQIFDQMLQQLESPIEFQLPDWLMKPKRMPYTFIKRSIHGN